jgi:hypothetical protein
MSRGLIYKSQAHRLIGRNVPLLAPGRKGNGANPDLKGLQVQAQGLGPYRGFLASVSLSGRKLLFTGTGHSATFRAKAISRVLLKEFGAIAYDQVPNPKASEVQSASSHAR